jgi:hypothetical protein
MDEIVIASRGFPLHFGLICIFRSIRIKRFELPEDSDCFSGFELTGTKCILLRSAPRKTTVG